jgi:phospholipid/cholesterol/gamma-HCH transport system substrate-binding protein
MKKYSVETVVGIFVLAGLMLISYMALTIGEVSFLGDGHYTLHARFTSVSGLREGSAVEVFGLEVGRVSGMSIDEESQMAVVDLKIRDDVKIYDDATASIRTSGLIGDRYVKIDPGGGGERLKPGSMIVDTTSPLDIEDLIGRYAFGEVEGEEQKDEKND